MVQPVGGCVGCRSDVLIVPADDLNPVAVGILGKSNVLHPTLRQLLLEGVACILESLARRLDVVNRDGDVTKSTVWLGVSVYDAVVGVILGTVVVSEFQHAVAVGPVAVTLEGRRAAVGEEVEREFVLREVELVDLVESKEFIELNWTRVSTNCGESEAQGDRQLST